MGNTLGVTVRKDKDFSEWYTQVIQKAELMDYSAVSGCMVMRPDAQDIWDAVRKYMDTELKKRGVRNASFPMFIPQGLMEKESKHVEGFSPEVAWVTHGGDSKLSEKLAVRPTSETIIYDSLTKWIRSHNDLPMKLNQWNSVVRWEFKHPVPFLRTREFFWQEGHTAHATSESAAEEVEDIINLYSQLCEELLAIPTLVGKKSDKEKFAGADYTLSIETLMPNGKAIQGATSHFLGRNFSKPFGIKFQDEDGKNRHVWTNSWGLSTRTIGMMVMMHGDDKGAVMPPMVAPIQAVIVPILFSDKDNAKIVKACRDVMKKLKCRARLDDRDHSPGWKFNHWELKGVPVRIEIGPKDVKAGKAMLARRDTSDKKAVKLSDVSKEVNKILEDMQVSLLKKAQKFLKDSIVKVSDVKGIKKAVDAGKIAYGPWCGSTECEESIKNRSGGAKTLNSPLGKKASGNCICGKKADRMMYFAKSY